MKLRYYAVAFFAIFLLTSYSSVSHAQEESKINAILESIKAISLQISNTIALISSGTQTASVSGSSGQTILLVDFGSDESSDTYGISGWNTTITDRYTRNVAASLDGTTIVTGSNRSYNYQGVTGSSRSFNSGDQIVATWYNDSDSSVTFTPRISFDGADRVNNGGTWYDMSEVSISPNQSGTSVYTFTSAAGNYSVVNVNVNYSNNRVIIADKIELVTGGSAVEPSSNNNPSTQEPVTCSSFTYSDWGSCQSNDTQTRSVQSSSPSGCTGGSPVTSRSCTYEASPSESTPNPEPAPSSVPVVTPSQGNGNFSERCSADGVIYCNGFDSFDDVYKRGHVRSPDLNAPNVWEVVYDGGDLAQPVPNNITENGVYYPGWDYSVGAEGTSGSLRLTTNPSQSQDVSGGWYAGSQGKQSGGKEEWLDSVGENDTIYLTFWTRHDETFGDTNWSAIDGERPKFFIMWRDESSCSDLQLVMNRTPYGSNGAFSGGYSNCGTGFRWNPGTYPEVPNETQILYKSSPEGAAEYIANGGPGGTPQVSTGNICRRNFYSEESCGPYLADNHDKWFFHYWKVQLGPYSDRAFQNSVVESWVSNPNTGKMVQKTDHWFDWPANKSGREFQNFLATLYKTGHDASVDPVPLSHVWYDNLVIAKGESNAPILPDGLIWSDSRDPYARTNRNTSVIGASGSVTNPEPPVVNEPISTPQPSPTKFSPSDTVAVSSDGSKLNVRSTANGTLLGQQDDGVSGTVVAGPVSAGGLIWYNVNFVSGVDGWVAEDYLVERTLVSNTQQTSSGSDNGYFESITTNPEHGTVHTFNSFRSDALIEPWIHAVKPENRKRPAYYDPVEDAARWDLPGDTHSVSIVDGIRYGYPKVSTGRALATWEFKLSDDNWQADLLAGDEPHLRVYKIFQLSDSAESVDRETRFRFDLARNADPNVAQIDFRTYGKATDPGGEWRVVDGEINAFTFDRGKWVRIWHYFDYDTDKWSVWAAQEGGTPFLIMDQLQMDTVGALGGFYAQAITSQDGTTSSGPLDLAIMMRNFAVIKDLNNINEAVALIGDNAPQPSSQQTPSVPQAPNQTTKFSPSDTVAVSSDGSKLNVRSTANGTLLGQQDDGVSGTVVAGPVSAGGLIWYNVNFVSGVDGWVAEDYITATAPPVTSNGSVLHVAVGGSGNGSASNPYGSIQAALNAVQPGQTILVQSGAYAESLSTKRSGSSGQPITVKAETKGGVTVLHSAGTFNVAHANYQIDGLVFDGLYGTRDAVRVTDAADNTTLRNLEIRKSGRDCIDVAGPDNFLIEDSLVHHCLFSLTDDAHGIALGPVQNATIRNTEIHTFTGDGVQVDPGRSAPGWTNVVIEDSHIWNQALPTTENGIAAGSYPGEDGIDTKAGSSFARAQLTIRNTQFNGHRGVNTGNPSALNLKENVDVLLDGLTIFDSENALRLRGPAHVTVQNSVVYDSDTAVRYEDNIPLLRVWNNTFGSDITSVFKAASSNTSGLDVKNNLIYGSSIPSEASHSSNKAASASDFVSVQQHNYRLRPTSGAINSGVTLSTVVKDLDGVLRPQDGVYEVGAHEYGGTISTSQQTPSVPQTPLIPTDQLPPVVYNGQPGTGDIVDTDSVNISVRTNESATCRYATTPNIAYNSMSQTLSRSGNIHSAAINNLVEGTSYDYYIKCRDTEGNTSSDATISFTVAGGEIVDESVGGNENTNSPANNTTNKPSVTTPVKTTSSSGGGGGSNKRNRTSSFTQPASNINPTAGTNANGAPIRSQVQSVSSPSFSYRFSESDKAARGSEGENVRWLQKALNRLGYTIASVGDGSPGNETNFFGPATEIALKRFQADNGIVSSGDVESTGYGALGPATREKLNQKLSTNQAANNPSSDVQLVIAQILQLISVLQEQLAAKLAEEG